MPFEIKVDADAVLKQLDALIKNVGDLEQETTTTFTAWQADDMHRKYPKVEGSGLSVSTTIYPRSQLTRRKTLPRRQRQMRRRSKSQQPRRGLSQHKPILRPELFEKLKERMVEMCKEAIEWR